MTNGSNYAGCHHDVEAPIDLDNNGVLFLNSSIRYEGIPDGSSNTLFVGEKLSDAGDLGWASGTRATLRNTGTALNGAGMPAFGGAAAAPIEPEPVEDDPDADPAALAVGGFSSTHEGGAHFALGDGSVRFISENIAPQVYQNLGHRADGQMIGEF